MRNTNRSNADQLVSIWVRGGSDEAYSRTALRIFSANNDGAAGSVVRITRTHKGATVRVAFA